MDYEWENGEWKADVKMEYTYDDAGREIKFHKWAIEENDGSWKDDSETEYGYDDQGRENMTAYYSYSSVTRKGNTKLISGVRLIIIGKGKRKKPLPIMKMTISHL